MSIPTLAPLYIHMCYLLLAAISNIIFNATINFIFLLAIAGLGFDLMHISFFVFLPRILINFCELFR